MPVFLGFSEPPSILLSCIAQFSVQHGIYSFYLEFYDFSIYRSLL